MILLKLLIILKKIADGYGIRKGHEKGQCKVLVKDVKKH